MNRRDKKDCLHIKFGNLQRIALAMLLILAGSTANGCRAEQPWPLWERYTQRFVDGQGRVIDHSAGDKTTSEGQSYALFFALVDNDRLRFEKLLNWTATNLAAGDLSARLPAWSWGRSDSGEWKVLDSNTASDSDLWIAYTLLEAGRLWHSTQYEALGNAMASHIASQEVAQVPGLGTTLIAGIHGFHPDANTWIVNPSYLPLPLLTRFARAMPHGPWRAVAASLTPVLSQGSGAGYAMDWLATGDGVRPIATPAEYVAGKKDGVGIGSYDAVRVYLWLGISDPSTPGRKELLAAVSGMASYLKQASAPPERVDSAGKILQPNSPVGFSAAVFPYLTAMSMPDAAKLQMERLASAKDASTGLYGSDPRYYDQNLALFATGWLEQRYRFDAEGKLMVKWK